MDELVFFIVSLPEVYKDSPVENTRDYTHGCACEFCGNLVVASRCDAELRAIVPIG